MVDKIMKNSGKIRDYVWRKQEYLESNRLIDDSKFEELFDIISKEYVVVTFLAILSMAKKQEISINQTNNFNEIIIEAKE